MKWSKKSQYVLIVGFTALLFAQLLYTSKLLDQWEYSTWSWREKSLAKPSAFSKDIKIILLDQSSLDWGASQNGLSWPWPREVYTLLLSFMHRAGAKVTAFDILYSEPSLYGVTDDEKFAKSVANNSVVLSLFLGQQTQQNLHWPKNIAPSSVKLNGLQQWLADNNTNDKNKLNASFPIPELANAAKMLAHVNEKADDDGVFRRFSLFQVFDQQILPSLGLGTFLFDKQDKTLTLSKNGLQIAGQNIATDAQGQVILKFRGGSGTHQSFNAAAIIQAELHLQAGEPSQINPLIFKDKYVFLGFSAPGLKDLRPTPVDGDYPGVEIHATLLDNLLAHDTIKPVPALIFWSAVLFISLAASYSIIFSTTIFQLAASFLFFTALPLGLGFGLYQLNFWWSIVGNEVAVIMALVNSVIFNYLTEGKQKRFIRSAFNQYLSVEVINRILDNPALLTLGGEKRELSILFSDIQGFSTISERLTPEQLVQLLNDYLTDMTDIIMEEGGTLDKYEGDAIIAFWNAPLEQPDHAMRICRAVLKCQRTLAARREEFYQRIGAWIYVRIGVHTGDVVVGNIGSKKRFDYTMLGDAANLASRLEGANKYFGTFTMISESTWLQTNQAFIGREIGTLKVVGRNTPVTVFELLGFKHEPIPAGINQYHQGLELYKKGQLKQAADIFAQLPDDPVAQVYLARCRKEQENVPTDWTGIWVLDEK
jgi:adenylate cyclase